MSNRGDIIYDVVIIGAGPTGLFAAFYAGLRGLRAKVIEALPVVGGQLTILYPEKYIYDCPGYPKILAKDLVKNLYEQALTFNPTFVLEERVVNVKPISGGIIQIDTEKNTHFGRTLLIAAGIGAFSPNKLNIPGAERFEGKGLYYFVKEKSQFKNKSVLIVGGGDSAVDWALNLKDYARKVTLIHRRDVFRAHESNVAELFKSNVDVKLFYELKSIHGKERVEGATIFNNKTNEETFLSVDDIIIQIGHKADFSFIKNWGLEINSKGVKVNGRMETNITGIFAAGDIADPIDSVKINLIAVGFAQAAIAINVIKKRLDPLAPLYEHSSEKRL
ncbi:MAG: NAD(P)/FAD-dependent oxidoreductase [Nitrososphaerales archaeon]